MIWEYATSCTTTDWSHYGSACSSDTVQSGSGTIRYYYHPCTSEYASATFATGTCPNGWGSCRTYNNYQSGCFEGKYYPSPTVAYTGPAQTIGSPH